MINVAALDGALRVSWKASKGATWYELFYRAPNGSYTNSGGTLTSPGTTITGLQNGVTYEIYIVAGNDIGSSGPSQTVTGTPQAVVYERPAGIPTQGVLEGQDFASIRLAAPSNYKRDEYTASAPFTPANMADGDYRTHWTARDWHSNEHVIVTFREPQDLSAAIWVPRLDGTYAGDLRAYSVQVWYAGENTSLPGHLITPGEDRGGIGDDSDVLTWPAIRGNPAVTKFAVMPFEPQRNVIQISVAAEQRSYNLVTLSELMFLKYDESHRLPDEIGELFADSLRTRLAPGVDQIRISQLRTRLNSDERNFYLELDALVDELELAEGLLASQPSAGVILNGLDSRSGAANVNHGQGGSLLQPLGVAAAAGQEITIYAEGIPSGEKVEVFATQFNAEANAWMSSMGTLENGRNVLTVPRIGSQDPPRGGSLYVSYSGSSSQSIRLHVRRTVDIPVLELSHWNDMTAEARAAAVIDYLAELNAYAPAQNTAAVNDWRNVTEISTPSVLLSLPAASVRSALAAGGESQLTNAVLAWEQVMKICRTVQGIPELLQTRQNIRCMQMFPGAFMYAAGSHIGIGYGSCGGMVSGSPVVGITTEANHLFGWGIAHEIGHNMDKLGKAEITNNIYSLAVQTFDGGQNILSSRLENSGKYEAIFNKTAQSRPGASGDVFVQLGMYWQLHLAYDEGDPNQPMNFFNKFFTAWKAGTYTAGADTYDDKVALTAAGVTQRNLTDFFTHWGMELSESTKNALAGYEAEERAIWYLNDQSRRDRLAGNVPDGKNSSVTASAKKTGEQEITISFSASVSNGVHIQGYEIFRNDTPIAFTTKSTYKDVIGSGNNRTYTYTVAAYDSLGNCIGKVTAPEQILISYDLLVDPTEYTVSYSGDVMTFTMNNPTAVSGLRLPLEGLGDGAYTITVTDASDVTHIVSQGTFAGIQPADSGRRLIYFQMAGDQTGNDRIGTYQAKSVTITGIPDAVQKEDVRLIRYAGDDISFWGESSAVATMGRLARDYTYTGGSGPETIPAGTLVVVGEFQGDPMYNTVRIRAEFAAPDTESGQSGDALKADYLPGEVLLFAQEQEDERYGTISKGIFLFVPKVQEETAGSACGGPIVLPARIRAELWRTVTPNSTEGTRCTAQTLWINCPGGDALPLIVLEGGGQ